MVSLNKTGSRGGQAGSRRRLQQRQRVEVGMIKSHQRTKLEGRDLSERHRKLTGIERVSCCICCDRQRSAARQGVSCFNMACKRSRPQRCFLAPPGIGPLSAARALTAPCWSYCRMAGNGSTRIGRWVAGADTQAGAGSWWQRRRQRKWCRRRRQLAAAIAAASNRTKARACRLPPVSHVPPKPAPAQPALHTSPCPTCTAHAKSRTQPYLGQDAFCKLGHVLRGACGPPVPRHVDVVAQVMVVCRGGNGVAEMEGQRTAKRRLGRGAGVPPRGCSCAGSGSLQGRQGRQLKQRRVHLMLQQAELSPGAQRSRNQPHIWSAVHPLQAKHPPRHTRRPPIKHCANSRPSGPSCLCCTLRTSHAANQRLMAHCKQTIHQAMQHTMAHQSSTLQTPGPLGRPAPAPMPECCPASAGRGWGPCPAWPCGATERR